MEKKVNHHACPQIAKKPDQKRKSAVGHLRKRQLEGYRFVRQKPLIYKEDNRQKYFFIADFYCAEKKLVVELDGKIHEYQTYYDNQRDLVLNKLGLMTLRIRNEELSDMKKVKRKILKYLE